MNIDAGGADREVTLIREETVLALRNYEVAFDAGDSRRNIVTAGVIRTGEAIEPNLPR